MAGNGGPRRRHWRLHAVILTTKGIAVLHKCFKVKVLRTSAHPSHCEERSDEAIHLSACGAMDCFAPLAMTASRFQPRLRVLAALIARGFPEDIRPLKTEGAGKTGCALHPRSRVQSCTRKCAHEHTGSAETLRPSPRNGFTAYNALFLVTGFLVTIASRDNPQNLTPASGRQNHTSSPYVRTCVRLSQASRPPHLTARS